MEYPDGDVASGLFGPVIRVGWLGPNQREHRGGARECLTTLLQLHDAGVVNQTRGYHMCSFCRGQDARAYPATFGELHLGSAELVVRGTNGQVFTVPNLIIHYIDAHDYLPPSDFVDACAADLGPFGLTPTQIVEGILTQDQQRLTAVDYGAHQTRVMREFLEFCLAEMLLDPKRYVPGAVPQARARWRHGAQVDLFSNPYKGREWLNRLINRLDPGVTGDLLQTWLQETQTWPTRSTVFPVSATGPYTDPQSEIWASWPPGL